jgi:hypothetical protein
MYVYFVQAFGEHELVRIKIGRSKNPEERLHDLQTGSAVKLKLLGKIKCRSNDHAKQVETLAHEIFYKQRKRGEWFRLFKSLIEKASGPRHGGGGKQRARGVTKI